MQEGETMSKEVKTIRAASFECPWCSKRIKVKVKEKILSPQVAAKKKTFVEAIKDTQTTLK